MEIEQTMPLAARVVAAEGAEGETHLTDDALWGQEHTSVAEQRPLWRMPWKMSLVALLGLVVGVAIGVLIARQRYQAANLVMSVNGSAIESRDFYHRLEVAAGSATLNQMLAEQLTLQYARKLGVTPKDADVEARFKEVSQRQDWGAYLTATRQTNEDVKNAIRVQLAQAAIVNRDLSVTDAEVRAYYLTQTDHANPAARYYTPAGVRIAIIVTPSEAQCRTALNALHGNTPFSEAARRFSRDSSRMNGGELATVYRGRSAAAKIPGLESTIFGMEVGQQIGPQHIAGGWWIIRCLDKTPAEVKPFDKVSAECRQATLVQKGLHSHGKQIQQQFREFRNHGSVVAFWPQYRFLNTR